MISEIGASATTRIECSKGGEDHHRVHRDMVRLQVVGVEEVPEEV
jgi:hypothetical protein